jgi:hypothetical protein
VGTMSDADGRLLPRYPVYVPSKGRAATATTPRVLIRDGCPFRLVVEPPDAPEYLSRYGETPGGHPLLVLPFSDLGQGAVPARNWIRDHAEAEGHAAHWQLDDNLQWFGRRWEGYRVQCDAGAVLHVIERFADRYENLALCGPTYQKFLPTRVAMPPFVTNVHVYSCTLVNHAMPYRWRGRYNDDTDLCLQALAGGWCTVLFNAFFVLKIHTMKLAGGMTASYQGDGRLKMARSLERRWPGVVETRRRFHRPQHVIKDSWRYFDTPLRLRPGVTLPEGTDEFGLRLTQVRPEIESDIVRAVLEDYRAARG